MKWKNFIYSLIILITLLILSCKEETKVYEQKQIDTISVHSSHQAQSNLDSLKHLDNQNFKLESIKGLQIRDNKNPLIGIPVSLRQLLFEQPYELPVKEAIDMAERGHPFVLLVKEKGTSAVYYVFNQNAEFLGKELAKYCGKTIKLIGKSFNGDDINIFYMEKIIVD